MNNENPPQKPAAPGQELHQPQTGPGPAAPAGGQTQHHPCRISQQDMQKIMPPNPDPDDPLSP